MLNRWKFLILFIFVNILISYTALGRPLRAETELFPTNDSIQANVNFWTKIYSEYSSRQGVIHDSKNLNIIYEIIDLRDARHPRGRKINKKKIKTTKSKYRSILQKLSQRRPSTPLSPEEQRIVDMLGLDAKPSEYQQARRRIRCQVGQKDRFREGIIRSGAYLDEIRRILRHYGIPQELAYLPHVESSFNPHAYSKFGAAGAWQFTRSTGRLYMTINYTIDERRDPIRAAHAAAKLLKRNYTKLNSWPMAISAYNHGLAGMLRAQRKHGRYENVFNNYRSRTFKFASRNFYSEFLAALAVADNYQKYFGELTLNTPVKTTEVTLAGYTSIPNLAKHLEIDLNRLRKLNPALRPPVFKGRKYAPKGYRLKLPADEHRNWKVLLAAAAEDIYRPDQKHSRLYQVDRGDTAGRIARLHGVSLQELIAFNNLDHRARIYVGQNLRIPVPETRTKIIASRSPHRTKRTNAPDQVPTKEKKNTKVETQRVPEITPKSQAPLILASTTEPSVPLKPSIDRLASTSEPEKATDDIKNLILASQTTGALQTVAIESERGDLVTPEISHVTVSPVTLPPPERSISPVSQTTFTSGEQDLAPLTGREPDPEIVTGSITVEKVLQQNNRPVGIIKVEIEETLGHYAEWAGVRARDIRRLNKMRYGHPIHLGQKLKIPLHRVDKEAFEETRFEYHKELVEDFFAAYRVDALKIYSIKRGDNIWTLSRDVFELPLWLIRRYNGNVDLSALMPSQNLRIPVVEKTS